MIPSVAPFLGLGLILATICTAALTLAARPTPGPAASLPAASTSPTVDASPTAGARGLLVAAAASLSDVIEEIATAFHAESGIEVRLNLAASNTLARQIIEGARVDVFISADAMQMDAVDRAGRMTEGTRFDLLGNQLKIIIGDVRGRGLPLVFRPPDLANPNVRRIATGDPHAVPVGVYARQWLEKIGLWSAVAAKVIPLPSSPAAVAAVREGRAEVGIVYTTDDRPRRGAYIVPVADAPRIVYPAARISGSIPEAVQFLNFLQMSAARDIFRAAGFFHVP